MKSITVGGALLVFVTAAIARNCKPDLNYCGKTLNQVGNYQPQIDQCLYDNGQGEVDYGANDLFRCIGGPNGVIEFLEYCKSGCHENPPDVSDACA